MPEQETIQYLTHQQIDKQKWDACIDKAPNGLIYAYSFYLDHMARNWDALILNDYEAVMPLTWNKKFGISYLYQPFLTAQLGLFGMLKDAQTLENFLKSIPKKFRYWDFYLNPHNVHKLTSFSLYERSNYVLQLDKPYASLQAGYRDNIKRNIRKAEQAGCSVERNFEADKVIALALEQMRKHTTESGENVKRFRRLFQHLQQKKMTATYGICLKEELLASCIFFYSHNRCYYILVGNHPNGKTIGASHALIDAFIKDHAGKNMVLDFEGSDIRNLAFFYSSYGAAEEKYAAIKLNRLPFYLRWLKR